MAHVSLPGAERPTLESLLLHAQKFGLDARDGLKRPIRYTGYNALSKDAVVEVGRDYLGEEAFVLLIEGLGYGHFRDRARQDWRGQRGLEPEDSE